MNQDVAVLANFSWISKPMAMAASAIIVILFSFNPVKAAIEVGVAFGPFLPSQLPGVSEVINGAAARAGMSTGPGIFEFEVYTAHGEAVDYISLSFDYLFEIGKDLVPEIPVFVLAGLNRDSYKPSTSDDFRQGGGFHYGAGAKIPLGSAKSPLQMRFDFKHRFGPGNSLIALLGLSFEFGNSTATVGAGKP